MKALVRYQLLAVSIGLITTFPSASSAADQPAGMVICSGSFQLDGMSVSNSATVFVGSKVDSAGGACTVRTSGGSDIRLEPQSGVAITATGVTLTRGAIRMKGSSDLGLPGATAIIRPTAPGTVVQAKIADNQFFVNVSTGSASLVGPKSELYARLGSGTLMRFAPAPGETTGVYLWALGCIHSEEKIWFVNDSHIGRKVELLGDTPRKNRQSVGVWGAMQQIPPNASAEAARLRIVQENPGDEACSGFVPVIALVGGALAGVGSWGGVPGQNPSSVSVP